MSRLLCVGGPWAGSALLFGSDTYSINGNRAGLYVYDRSAGYYRAGAWVWHLLN